MHPPRPKLLLLRGCGAPCFRRGGAACANRRAPGVSRARLDPRAVYAGTTSPTAPVITVTASTGAVPAWCRWMPTVAQLLIRRRRPKQLGPSSARTYRPLALTLAISGWHSLSPSLSLSRARVLPNTLCLSLARLLPPSIRRHYPVFVVVVVVIVAVLLSAWLPRYFTACAM